MNIIFYILIFTILIIFSAFFSSAETSLLSINKIKLNLRANKKNKKAVLLTKILENPDEFFSTVLIGNNLVNIAAASISTIVFTRLIVNNEELILLTSTAVTTIIILIFAEIIPKSYAFRYNEKMSYLYAYPIKFFNYLFYPFVKISSIFSNFFLKKSQVRLEKKELTMEEIKHFLATEIKLFRYNPESLRMINEIIDISQKDIKSIMTPRPNIIALEESAGINDLKEIILNKKVTKIPIYKENLDHITGIIHAKNIIPTLMVNNLKNLELKELSAKPIFISEYSSLNYTLKKFKKHESDIAIILNEYGVTIGILTISDIFREILGEIKISKNAISKSDKNTFIINGSISVEEMNAQLKIKLPEKKDYTTVSGMFIYHFGKFPAKNSKIKIKDNTLIVKTMGDKKIDEIILKTHEK